MKRSTDRPIPRRRALRILGGSAAGLGTVWLGTACLASGGLTLLTGCATDTGSAQVRLPLADLPEGVRVRVALGVEPVEVLRTADGIQARSLTCTHTGCEVAWIEVAGEYLCPCHDARFDADGRVLWGPPRLPLESVPARVEGSEVVIGGASLG